MAWHHVPKEGEPGTTATKTCKWEKSRDESKYFLYGLMPEAADFDTASFHSYNLCEIQALQGKNFKIIKTNERGYSIRPYDVYFKYQNNEYMIEYADTGNGDDNGETQADYLLTGLTLTAEISY